MAAGQISQMKGDSRPDDKLEDIESDVYPLKIIRRMRKPGYKIASGLEQKVSQRGRNGISVELGLYEFGIVP